jgi:hypothetical protein
LKFNMYHATVWILLPDLAIKAATGDCVRNGMSFFLNRPDTGETLATERIFLLPLRSCPPSTTAPRAAIQANPQTVGLCATKGTATLAWYSAGVQPIEVRESTPTGRTVGRFDQTSGLLDVSPTAAQTYHLVGYSDGAWQDLASESIYVSSFGCGD